MNIRERITAIRTLLREPQYLRWLLPLSTLYIIAVLAVYAYIYEGNLLIFYTSYPLSYTLIASILNVASSILLGVVLTLTLAQYRKTKLHGAGLGAIAILFGSIAMGCPGCFFGIFPLILGLFGISATLAILPWNGIEFQLLTVILLVASALMLAPSDACELPKKK